MKISIMAVLIMLLSVSCAKEYTYSPPESEAGKACVSLCQANQNSCKENESDKANKENQQCKVESKQEFSQCEITAQTEFDQCGHDAKIKFNACREYATTLAARGLCEEPVCQKRTCYERGCYETANYDFCASEFRGCFQQCGGIIGVMK